MDMQPLETVDLSNNTVSPIGIKPMKRKQSMEDAESPSAKRSRLDENATESSTQDDIQIIKVVNGADSDCEIIACVSSAPANTIRNDVNVIFSKLSAEIIAFVNETQMSAAEVERNKRRIINDLNNAIRNVFKFHGWHTFGSFANDLACKGSDIDLYFQARDGSENPVSQRKQLFNQISNSLRRSPQFTRVFCVRSARVPVIKLVHGATQTEMDISFSTELGVRNSYLMKLYVNLDKNLKPLVLFLKVILKKYDLHGTGKLTTYLVFWMAVFFMQQNQLLPPVLRIREAATDKYLVSGWDCSLPNSYKGNSSTQSPSLFVLLRDFLKFYSNFNFLKYVICPYMGEAFLVENFINLKLPYSRFATYIQRVKRQQASTFDNSAINIQDPSEHSLNISRFLEATVASKFTFLCNFLQKVLFAYDYEGMSIDKINIMKILPANLPFDSPKYKDTNLFSYTRFELHNITQYNLWSYRGREFECVTAILHNVMTVQFDFQAKHVFQKNVTKITDKGQIFYALAAFMDYTTTSNTWKYYNTSTSNRKKGREPSPEPINVNFVCVSRPAQADINIYAQGEIGFILFLRSHLYRTLCSEGRKPAHLVQLQNF